MVRDFTPMNQVTPPIDLPPTEPLGCSRPEAIEIAIRTTLAAHAVVSALALLFEILLLGPMGVYVGLGVVLTLWFLFPVVLPFAYVIGWLTHRMFHSTSIAVQTAVRAFAILFELNLLGWIMVISIELVRELA